MSRISNIFLLCAMLAFAPAVSGFVEDVRWLAENQHYDLVLNPETIPEMTGYSFETYFYGEEQRLIISDRRDGLWRVNADLVLFQSTPPEEPLSDLPGDQHALSFSHARNILIEGLDIYAHEVEEALKFSACANVVVRNCRLISSRTSEDALDIVRGQNYIFDRVWMVGLGDRGMTVKGSARWVDVVESAYGLHDPNDFHNVFNAEEVTVGDRNFQSGDKLLPRRTIPSWIRFCLLFSNDRALAVELGGWSDYDIGYINDEGQKESRPPTEDVRIDAWFTDAMDGSCDRRSDLVPVLQWHTAKSVTASGWIFKPTDTAVFGDLVEELYYKETEPSPQREAELREELGPELDYWGVELPRYAVQPGEYGNNRFFAALYNFDNQFLFSPFIGWFFVFGNNPPGHDFMQPGTWIYHYPTSSWYLFLEGDILPNARWWNSSNGAYYHGALEPEEG